MFLEINTETPQSQTIKLTLQNNYHANVFTTLQNDGHLANWTLGTNHGHISSRFETAGGVEDILTSECKDDLDYSGLVHAHLGRALTLVMEERRSR